MISHKSSRFSFSVFRGRLTNYIQTGLVTKCFNLLCKVNVISFPWGGYNNIRSIQMSLLIDGGLLIYHNNTLEKTFELFNCYIMSGFKQLIQNKTKTLHITSIKCQLHFNLISFLQKSNMKVLQPHVYLFLRHNIRLQPEWVYTKPEPEFWNTNSGWYYRHRNFYNYFRFAQSEPEFSFPDPVPVCRNQKCTVNLTKLWLVV
jgi:hypothetical protein